MAADSRRLSVYSLLNPTETHNVHAFPTQVPNPTRQSTPESHSTLPSAPSIQHNVYINRKTTLKTLYTYYDIHTLVEYPQTDHSTPIGHLFHLDPSDWHNPTLNFAYSLGVPSGRSRTHESITCALLENEGAPVPCAVTHFTCM